MIFTWWKQQRRRRLLATPFPAEWLDYLRTNVAYYAYLNEAEQARLRDDLRVFVAEKHWEGCRGLTITDEIKVTIAAQACLLLLGMEHDYFGRVKSILVYPSAFRVLEPTTLGDSFTVASTESRLGEAWYRGPVILAWDDVLAGGRSPGEGNTVFHEFAHQLDFLDGLFDGTPPLQSPKQVRRWAKVMTAELDRLRRAADRGRPTLLDPYGATNEGEFFAVATECFFEKPAALAREYPALYDLLRTYYHQDPAQRWPGLEGP